MAAPVKHTCPDIDKVIKAINTAMKTAAYGMKNCEKNSDEYDLFKDIEWELDGLERILEDLRSANSQLRHWAEGNEEVNNELREIVEKYEPEYLNVPEVKIKFS